MTLAVTKAAAVAANTPFVIVVPGQQLWTVQSVFAVCSTHAGGSPNRSFLLTVSDGTNTLAASGANDAGTEPATVSVTWANTSSATATSAATGVSVGAFPTFLLHPGYVLTGSVVAGVATDIWTTALCWYDYRDT